MSVTPATEREVAKHLGCLTSRSGFTYDPARDTWVCAKCRVPADSFIEERRSRVALPSILVVPSGDPATESPSQEPEMTATTAPAERIKTFAQAEERLAVSLPGYESRPQQQALATAVEQCLAERKHLLAEAGCGTGKSLATAIPAILSGKKVVISTATKALQEQVANKDVPFLQEHLGVDFTFALLKGRSNYFCWAKATNANPAWTPNLGAMQEELEANPEHTGDREHFAVEIDPKEWANVSSSSAECPGKNECPFGKTCLSEAAKMRARAADVVVTNHAMLFTDLKVREMTEGKANMLGNYEAVILDEAHEVEEIATSALSDEIKEAGIRRLMAEVASFAGSQDRPQVTGVEVLSALDTVWALLPEGVVGSRFFLEQEPQFTALIHALQDLAEIIRDIEVIRGDEKTEAKRNLLATRCGNYAFRLTEVMLASDGEMVRWIEMVTTPKGDTIKSFKNSPLNVAPWLDANLWSRVPSILVSATLSVKGNFSYVTSRLGLPEPMMLNVGTPFDFQTQAMLYVPAPNMPNPSKDQAAWRQTAAVQTLELVSASKGGALLLFTSRSAMEQSYEAIAPRMREMGLTVLKQGDRPNKALAADFMEDGNAVLFALKSFFTGVDFAGDALRLVVIDKMPFAVPTDIIWNARCQDYERRNGSRSAFGGMTIPAMTLTLLQGFGRLIRTRSDRGVVAILDPRLSATGYGKGIVESLPDCPATTNLTEAQAFFS